MKLIVNAHTDINLVIHVNGKTGKGERKFPDRFIAQHMDYVTRYTGTSALSIFHGARVNFMFSF